MSQKLLLTFIVFVFASSVNAELRHIAYRSGAQEVPPVNSAASGFCEGRVSEEEFVP